MGQWFEFACSGCGYRVEVSGGLDCGMDGYVHTVACRTCRPAKLRDAEKVGDRWEIAERLGPEDFRCPGARTREHQIALWRHPGKCPRCDAAMVRNEESFAIWD